MPGDAWDPFTVSWLPGAAVLTQRAGRRAQGTLIAAFETKQS